MEEQAQPQTSTSAQSATINVQPATQDDLMSKVTSFIETKSPEPVDPVQFDSSKINDIKTPEEARKFAENAYKSLESGYTKKFQELANLRKSMEEAIGHNKQWTPEKVKGLLEDPAFVQAANQIAGQGTSDETSLLSDAEKAKINALENELRSLKEQSLRVTKDQEDQLLSTRYKNYDPKAVDTLTADLIAGKVQAKREHLYKVLYHDDNVKNAYQLGLKDGQAGNLERKQSISVDGVTQTRNDEGPKMNEGETPKNFWKRISALNLAKTAK